MAPTKNETTIKLLEEFRAAMERSEKDFMFACGGSSTDPVTVRWDPIEASTPARKCKISFPAESDALSPLIGAMQQATFGLGGKDVLDESYRKALKLDTSAFSTNLCPYKAGIMDTVSQILVAGVSEHPTSIIRAELYKLNIYERPSGHFHSHVDTPRSPSQFGSLVVCLSAAHSGGELVVLHNGKTMTFDWGSAPSPAVQWAAFYSDCEHKVLQVHSGQRVTLTYNLYACTTPAELGQAAMNTPLAQHIGALLSNKDFMPRGGYLGFYASHAYPHSSHSFAADLNSAPDGNPPLTGIDRALWQTSNALGCRCILHPIINYKDQDSDYDYDQSDSDSDGAEAREFDVQAIGRDLVFTKIDSWIDGPAEIDGALTSSGYLEPVVSTRDVEWLNSFQWKNQEPALAYIAYGNKATVDYLYSYCAILIRVPKMDSGTGTRMRLQAPAREIKREPASPPVISSASFGG